MMNAERRKAFDEFIALMEESFEEPDDPITGVVLTLISDKGSADFEAFTRVMTDNGGSLPNKIFTELIGNLVNNALDSIFDAEGPVSYSDGFTDD